MDGSGLYGGDWLKRGVSKKTEDWFENYVDGDGSESANSSGVSISGLLSCEMEYKTEMCELVSEFMPDVILLVGKSGGGKAKKWNYCNWSVEVGLGVNLSGVGIQVVGSSWAKKIIILRLKSGVMGLFL